MSTRERSWPVPVALAALSAIPVTAGVLRLIQLAGGPSPLPADPRFTGLPLALVLHLLGAATFALLGLLQLVPGFRRRHPTWHRRAGRVLVVAGLTVAGSALWLTLLYDVKPGTGPLLYVARLIVAPATAGCVVLGVVAVRRRDIPSHRAWMIRAYALALGAGTQAFTEGFGEALFGSGELRGDLYKASAWLLNLAVAELVIRQPGRGRRQARPERAEVVALR